MNHAYESFLHRTPIEGHPKRRPSSPYERAPPNQDGIPLRAAQDDLENLCFVCGMDRNTFDRKHPIGFEHHIKHEHNIWQYLAFILHLRFKEATDLTGARCARSRRIRARPCESDVV
eukprot:1772341-Pleurochrysis_carterae.AAC.1